MKHYLEDRIERQLNLLDLIYYSRSHLTIEEISDKLSVTPSTIQRDLSYMDLIDDHGQIRSDIDRETKVMTYNGIMGSSLVFQLIIELLYRPGKRPDDYCQILNISRTNFYKYIALIRALIEHYGGSIMTHDGYYIIASDEHEFRYFLLHYFFIYTNIEIIRITDLSDNFIEKLLRRNHFRLTFFNNPSSIELHYHIALFWTILIRCHTLDLLKIKSSTAAHEAWDITHEDFYGFRNLGIKIKQETINHALTEFKKEIILQDELVSKSKVHGIADRYFKMSHMTFNPLQYENIIGTLHSIINVLYPLSLKIQSDLRGTSLSLSDFFYEYSLVNDELIENYINLRNGFSKELDINFEYYDDIFFYWTVLYIGDLVYLPQKKILFVNKKLDYYSVYLSEEVKKLMETFKISPIFTFADRTNYEAMIQDETFDLIISDFKIDEKYSYGSIIYSNNALMYERVIDYVKRIIKQSHRRNKKSSIR